MEKDEANGEIINMGNPVGYSVLEVAYLIKTLADSTSTITFPLLPQDDPKVRGPVIEKGKALLGWSPTVSLEEGLKRTIDQNRLKLNLH